MGSERGLGVNSPTGETMMNSKRSRIDDQGQQLALLWLSGDGYCTLEEDRAQLLRDDE